MLDLKIILLISSNNKKNEEAAARKKDQLLQDEEEKGSADRCSISFPFKLLFSFTYHLLIESYCVYMYIYRCSRVNHYLVIQYVIASQNDGSRCQ